MNIGLVILAVYIAVLLGIALYASKKDKKNIKDFATGGGLGIFILTLTFSATGTVAKLAMRQPFVLFKGLTFQKLCLPGAFRPGDHHNKMLRPGLCVVHASPQYL